MSSLRDENRTFKTRSLRTLDGKAHSGQTGHEGNTLEITEAPDFIIEHKPQYCNHCGRDITGIEAELVTRRQIIDIPPIIPLIYRELIGLHAQLMRTSNRSVLITHGQRHSKTCYTKS
jgi:hypothetical protein